MTRTPTEQDIPENEKWRLIHESGVLKAEASKGLDSDLESPIFDTILFVIPFSFLYLMMDMLVHMQYGQHPSTRDYVQRLSTAVPVLFLLVYNINHRKSWRRVQLGLFVASLLLGMRLVWIVNHAPWYVIIKQGPPLATLWVYAIAVLDLTGAVTSLALVGVWLWWFGMKLLV